MLGSRKRKIIAVLVIVLAAVIAVGVFGNQGSSSSSNSSGLGAGESTANGTEETNGPASFVGHATNAVLFVQWTRSGQSVTGSLREAITKKPAGSGLTSTDKAFTGVIDGS